MRSGPAFVAIVCGASLASGAVLAAPVPEAPSPGALTPQAGPGSAPAPTPPFAQPQTFLPTPSPSAPTPPGGAGATVTLSDVHVDADASIRRAHPRNGWRPERGAPGAIHLELDRREAMDAAWVRRQFVLNHLVGAPTSADRIVSLVLLINEAYVDNGYINSGVLVPPQDWSASTAVLELRLVAGRIVPDPVTRRPAKVTWAKGGSQRLPAGYVERRVPSASQTPLNVIDLERDFRLLADDPALRTVNAQLTPGAQAGEASLDLTVAPQPWIDLYLGEANSRNPSVGAYRSFAGGSVRNFIIGGDQLSLDAGDTRGLIDATLAYSTPIITPNTFFDVQALTDWATVIDPAVRELNIRSSEQNYEAGLTERLIDEPLMPGPNGVGWRPARRFSIGLRVARRLSTSSLLGMPFSFSPGALNGRTDLTVLRATASFVERSDKQVIAASSETSFGLQGTRVTLPGTPTPNPYFQAELVQLNYARRLTTGGLEFRARFVGQWANSPLYSMEQLSAGGEDTVRGYRENLLLADRGAIASAEIDCPIAVGAKFCAAPLQDWKTVRVGIFGDGAYLQNVHKPQPPQQGLASAGLDIGWTPTPIVAVRLTYGYAIVRPVLSGPRDLEDHGFEFSVILHPTACCSIPYPPFW